MQGMIYYKHNNIYFKEEVFTMKSFTIKFDGRNEEEVAERFAAYFWDGGLDQYLESEFLAQFDLNCDDMEMVSNYEVKINTDKR
jgi:hypothetical protein